MIKIYELQKKKAQYLVGTTKRQSKETRLTELKYLKICKTSNLLQCLLLPHLLQLPLKNEMWCNFVFRIQCCLIVDETNESSINFKINFLEIKVEQSSTFKFSCVKLRKEWDDTFFRWTHWKRLICGEKNYVMTGVPWTWAFRFV